MSALNLTFASFSIAWKSWAGNISGLILKIETRKGFDNLPKLILAAMRTRSIGIMIARGDLAVECGYQRLAEVQEEILWICEAAHVPVIWATQVLETSGEERHAFAVGNHRCRHG